MAKKKSDKHPRLPQNFVVDKGKNPRIQHDVASFDGMMPVWQLSKLDFDWDHSWDKIGRERWERHVLPALRDNETMTWNEIKSATGGRKAGTNSHNVPIDRLSKAAQKRLTEIGQDDIDELFSLRFGGKNRIWGIKDKNILRIIWFDFDHAICPMADK